MKIGIDAIIKQLEMIEADMENDAKELDGRPFNGRTVAEYFGYQGAAIAALANTLKIILLDKFNCQKEGL